MHAQAILLMFITFLPEKILSYNDPCNDGNHGTLYREKYRGTLCPHRIGKTTSDRDITEQWYKINGADGPLTMPTEPVPIFQCSTVFPGWMSGQHPTVEEGEANRTVCFTSHLEECFVSINISVKNCTGFYVYYLKRSTSNSEGYCFGTNVTCPPLDPCEDMDREADIIDDGFRSPYCKKDEYDLCDNSTSGWRRILAADKSKILDMPQFCPQHGHCGTDNPVWLNDSYPTKADGIATRTVCIRSAVSCCESSFTIQMKNCTSFISFNLTGISACSQRYCFGDYHCDISTTTADTTSTGIIQSTNRNEGVAVLKQKGSLKEEIAIPVAIGTAIVVAGIVGVILFYRYSRYKRRARSVSDIQLVKG